MKKKQVGRNYQDAEDDRVSPCCKGNCEVWLGIHAGRALWAGSNRELTSNGLNHRWLALLHVTGRRGVDQDLLVTPLSSLNLSTPPAWELCPPSARQTPVSWGRTGWEAPPSATAICSDTGDTHTAPCVPSLEFIPALSWRLDSSVCWGSCFLCLQKFEEYIFITIHLNFCLVNAVIFRKYTHGHPAFAAGGAEEY